LDLELGFKLLRRDSQWRNKKEEVEEIDKELRRGK
jgi:hypothetical protein